MTVLVHMPVVPVFVIGSIPHSVEKLLTDHRLIKDDLRVVPSSVQDLELVNWDSVQDDFEFFPEGIRKLKITSFIDPAKNPFVFPPGCFPPSLIELDIPTTNIKMIPNLFPKHLKVLKFRTMHKITKSVLPDSLMHLEFYSGFKQDVSKGDSIPDGVKSIQFPTSLNKKYEGLLPTSVNTLCMNFHPNQDYGKLAPGLTYLTLKGLLGQSLVTSSLPSTLTFLDCHIQKLRVGQLPQTLQTLVLQKQMYRIEIGSIPESVTKIQMCSLVSIPIIKGTLPSSLTDISFVIGISQKVPFPILPADLKVLLLSELGFKYKVPVGSLPNSIQQLTFTGKFISLPIPKGSLPLYLKVLDFSDCSTDFPLEITDSIPDTIEKIKFPRRTVKNNFNLYYSLILKLLSNSQSRLEIEIRNFKLFAFDPKDPYIYYHCTERASIDGFIIKSNIKLLLYSILSET
eukprot:gene8084-9948_t